MKGIKGVESKGSGNQRGQSTWESKGSEYFDFLYRVCRDVKGVRIKGVRVL